MTIIAFQIDEFGTTGRTTGGEVLRSNTIPTFSFDYDVLTYTQNERSRFWQLERHKLTEEQEAEENEAENAERDEKQEALEQWLRRVPDDPGGLLRRKFQHETKQRLRQGDYSNREQDQIW